MISPYDKKAVKILFDTYWTSAGWRKDHDTPPDDFDYAVGKGLMFPRQVFPHDESVRLLEQLCVAISPSDVGDAFLASLSSRELAYRSALGSYAVAVHRHVHPFVKSESICSRVGACRICGLALDPQPFRDSDEFVDVNVLNFERIKWGGVRHAHIDYEIFDLEEFRKLSKPQPSADDISIFRSILALPKALPPTATVGQLEKAMKGMLPSTKSERRQLIGILTLAGIFAYPGYRHLFDETEPPKGRPYRDTDWGSPAMYWRAQDGLRIEHLRKYFPEFVAELVE